MSMMIETPYGPVAEEDVYMLSSEAARHIGVSHTTLAKLTDNGTIRSYPTIGGYHIYRYSDVEKIAQSYRDNPPRKGIYRQRHMDR